jgi:hypothetical protein
LTKNVVLFTLGDLDRLEAAGSSMKEKPPDPASRLRARAVTRAKELERLFAERFITPGREDREVLSYLTPKRASSFVTSIVRQLPREEWGQSDKHDFYDLMGIGNDLVELICCFRKPFQPDLQSFFTTYLELYRKAAPQREEWVGAGKGTVSGHSGYLIVSWQLAWAIAHAGMEQVREIVVPALSNEQEDLRQAATQLLEDASYYAMHREVPIFGGGTGPGGHDLGYRSLADRPTGFHLDMEGDGHESLKFETLSLPIPEASVEAVEKKSPQVSEEDKSPIPPEKPTFYFKLEGLEAGGNAVKYDSEVDVIFNYAVPPDDVLAKLTGMHLEEIRSRSGSVDLTIIPHGFAVRSGASTKTAEFEGGRLKAELRFLLRADDQPVRGSGVSVIFRVNGALIYEHYLSIRLVPSMSSIPVITVSTAIDLDLEKVLKARESREQRDYVLIIDAQDERYSFQPIRNRQVPERLISTITPARLADLLQNTNASVSEMLNRAVVFSGDFHSFNPGKNPNAIPYLHKCLESLATAGWQLYRQLSEDAACKRVLQEINELPPGSRIAINTDGCFIPWGILYPTEFNEAWPDDQKAPVDPQQFWGYRFLIESLLVGSFSHEPQPLQREIFVSLNINQSIDDKLKDYLSFALQSHKTFFEHTMQAHSGEIRNTPDSIKALLSDKQAQASFMYFYCHGQSEKAFQPGQREKIEIAPKTFLDPFSISEKHTFPNHPVVFLNSCSAGAVSPLSFLNFSKRFKSTGAEGMIVPDFAVPIKFAAAFGQEIMHRYLDGQAIGEALLDLRRMLLEHLNPLGLLYSLQCPLDVRAAPAEPESVL